MKEIECSIRMMAVEEVHPYENNPRINKDAVKDVATSIKKYGFKQPIVIDKDGVIVVGHTRYQAALQLGYKKVPCVVSDLSDKENSEYRIADNKTNEASTWDFGKLDIEKEMKKLDFSEFDFDIPAFDIDDLDNLFTRAETKQPLTSSSQPVASAPMQSAPGQIVPMQSAPGQSLPIFDSGAEQTTYEPYQPGNNELAGFGTPPAMRTEQIQCPHCGQWIELNRGV